MGYSSAQQKQDKAALKAYLQQYPAALRQRDALKHRAAAFSAKRNPEAAIISARLEKQQAQVMHTIRAVAEIIEQLPPETPERAVVEMRYVDCASWTKIADRLYMSRSTAFNYHARAFERLLADKTVRQRVRKYARQKNKQAV